MAVVPPIPEDEVAKPKPRKVGDIPPQYHHRVGEFTVPSTMPQEPTITVDYWVPTDAEGRPLPTAQDIVLLFPHKGYGEMAKVGFSVALVKGLGFTVLMPRFKYRAAQPEGAPKTSFYIFPSSGSDQVYLEAVKRVVAMENLAKPHLYALGHSAGASAAQMFASAHPDVVKGVFNGAGGTFNLESPYLGPMLTLRTVVDRMEAIPALAAAMNKHGKDLWEITYPPSWESRGKRELWYHGIGGRPAEFGQHWLRWLADEIRAGRDGSATWPARLTALRQTIVPASVPVKLDDLLPGLTAWASRPITKPERYMLWLDARFTVCEEDVRGAADLWVAKGVACLGLTDDARLDRDGLRQLVSRAIANQQFGSPGTVVVIEPSSDRLPALEGLARSDRQVIAWFTTPGKAARFRKTLPPMSQVQVRTLALAERKISQEADFKAAKAAAEAALAKAEAEMADLKPDWDRDLQQLRDRQQQERTALGATLKTLPAAEQSERKAALAATHKAEQADLQAKRVERQQAAKAALAVAKSTIPKPPKEIKLPDFWGAALAARVDDVAEMLGVRTATP